MLHRSRMGCMGAEWVTLHGAEWAAQEQNGQPMNRMGSPGAEWVSMGAEWAALAQNGHLQRKVSAV